MQSSILPSLSCEKDLCPRKNSGELRVKPAVCSTAVVRRSRTRASAQLLLEARQTRVRYGRRVFDTVRTMHWCLYCSIFYHTMVKKGPNCSTDSTAYGSSGKVGLFVQATGKSGSGWYRRAIVSRCYSPQAVSAPYNSTVILPGMQGNLSILRQDVRRFTTSMSRLLLSFTCELLLLYTTQGPISPTVYLKNADKLG